MQCVVHASKRKFSHKPFLPSIISMHACKSCPIPVSVLYFVINEIKKQRLPDTSHLFISITWQVMILLHLQQLIIVNELLDIMIDNTGTATYRSYTFIIACMFSVHACACIHSMFSLHASCFHASNRAHIYHHVYRIL